LYLLDVSAIVNIAKRGKLKAFSRASTLDLALYESLNAVWKEIHLLKRMRKETGIKFAEVLAEALALIEKHSISGLERKVLELALKEGLTVYDAAYMCIALEKGLMLVTDDEKLRKKASKYVKTMTSLEMLKQQL
jgi:predicted nucleic acid-binding protein